MLAERLLEWSQFLPKIFAFYFLTFALMKCPKNHVNDIFSKCPKFEQFLTFLFENSSRLNF